MSNRYFFGSPKSLPEGAGANGRTYAPANLPCNSSPRPPPPRYNITLHSVLAMGGMDEGKR